MGCLSNVVKYVLIAVNALYALFAVIFVACGGLILLYQNGLPVESDIKHFIPIIIIVFGGLLFLISIFGCCGVIAEKTCLLIVSVVFMLLLIGAKIYVAVIIPNLESDRLIEDVLNNMFNDSSTREIFYLFETVFTCCGTTGADSYEKLNVTLPITCCPLPDTSDLTNVTDVSEIQLCSVEDAYTGCTQIFVDLFNPVFIGLFYAVITVMVIEAVAVLFALVLMCNFRKKKKMIREIAYEPTAPPHNAFMHELRREIPMRMTTSVPARPYYQ